MNNTIKKYFEFDQLSTQERPVSYGREFIAGLSTYLSLSYIFVVNATILSAAGIPAAAVLFATVFASALATLVMGVFARLPFALAPGLEMNAYIAFYIVATLGFSWQESLAMVCLSGVLVIILTLVGVRRKIISSIPTRVKFHITYSVGIFVFATALLLINVVSYDQKLIAVFNFEPTHDINAAVIGVLALLILRTIRFPGAILVSILIAATYLNLFGGFVTTGDIGLTENWSKAFFEFDFNLWTFAAMSAVFTLFVVDFYGTLAKFIALTMNTPISIEKRASKALSVDGAATIFGSALGTTSVTTFVESGVGIAAGGRTGITAIVCSIFMALSIFLAPVIQYVPVSATSPALFYVAYKLMPPKHIFKDFSKFDWTVVLLSTFVVILFFSLDKAMLLVFAAYLIYGRILNKEKNLFLTWSTVILAAAFILSMLQIFLGY